MAFSILSFRSFLSSLSGRRLGVYKTAAVKLGIDLETYIKNVEANRKSCIDCKQWKDRGEFATDLTRWDELASKCKACAKGRYQVAYPIPNPSSMGRPGVLPSPLPDGDKVAARQIVNIQVGNRSRPNPNDLCCVLCGHRGDDKRHEYHHHMGYAAGHVNNVLPLCTECHHREHGGP